MMKRILFFAALALLVASCEKDPDFDKLDADLAVYTDHSSTFGFDKVETYYLPDSILEAGGYRASYWTDNNARQIINQAAACMDAYGYKRITDWKLKNTADVGLQLSYVAQRNQVTQVGGFGGWWDYGFWGPWYSGWYYPYAVSYTYDTNTFIMEMVDLKADKQQASAKLPVVWYAQASGFMYGGRYNLQLLTNAVSQAFKQSSSIFNHLLMQNNKK